MSPKAKPLQMLGMKEVVALVGMAKATINNRVLRGTFPAPDWEIAAGPVWASTTIALWQMSPELWPGGNPAETLVSHRRNIIRADMRRYLI
jgi:predicted DNA-binding transcriptional regulator AlpA